MIVDEAVRGCFALRAFSFFPKTFWYLPTFRLTFFSAFRTGFEYATSCATAEDNPRPIRIPSIAAQVGHGPVCAILLPHCWERARAVLLAWVAFSKVHSITIETVTSPESGKTERSTAKNMVSTAIKYPLTQV